jgi:hypothetical protein
VDTHTLMPIAAGNGWTAFEQVARRTDGPWHAVRVAEFYRGKSGNCKVRQHSLAWTEEEHRFARGVPLQSLRDNGPRILAEVEAALRRVRWPNLPLISAEYGGPAPAATVERIEATRIDLRSLVSARNENPYP